jgi:tRNA pseudouridine32 synthase/23S rRNA pseudouridine746 synthase
MYREELFRFMTSSDKPEIIYQGNCPHTGQRLSLPCTPSAQEAALQLLKELGPPVESKMVGVLLLREGGLLRAFSGAGPGPSSELEWAPCLEAGSPWEADILQRLNHLKGRLDELSRAPEWVRLADRESHWQQVEQAMLERHRAARLERHRQPRRSPQLDQESRAHKRQRKDSREARQLDLEPLRLRVAELEQQRMEVKRERRQLSQSLQADMHRNLRLFPCQPWSLATLFENGPPTGVGQCCAPKLLHQALVRGLRPLALAEVWWGEGMGRHMGEFSRACASRCQPLIGPLLASRPDWLRILYQDEDLMVVDKPAGVLSVAGRASWNQDCLLARLQDLDPNVRPVHRLDLETSGVLLLARNRATQAHLQRQFEARTVKKTYLARLQQCPDQDQGRIDLALAADPERSGCYLPDPHGKPALTHYRVIERATARLELSPHSGRSHQLRVHMRWGLNAPILGDRLYGQPGDRLMLHARRLEFVHPQSQESVAVESDPPF